MKKVTAKNVISWHPCKEYSAKRIKRLFGARKFATAKQILAVDLPPRDLLWCVLRPEMIDEKTLRLFACRVAERALRRERKAGREPAEASWEAVRVAKRFAHGKASEAELEKAELAALSAAYSAAYAARSAARSAASSAIWSAAEAASAAARSACSAARSAAEWWSEWSAARAAGSAAYAAESALQVKQLVKMLA